jgi:hypothetical protein
MININKLRSMIIALLDDEGGICSNGYDSLREFVSSIGKAHPQHDKTADEQCDDIWIQVESIDGYYYLPESHDLQ